MALRLARSVAVVFAVAALAGGCSSDETEGVVTGAVTLDGVPLKAGQIRFVPVDGETATAGAVITDGQYSATVAPGPKTVEISSPKEGAVRSMYSDAPQRPPAGGDLIPARYNAKTELKVDIRPGAEQHDFDLQSK
jgi:hypothetical protein